VTTQTERADPFLTEYSSDDAVRHYSKGTAGSGINYLLEHEYGAIYLKALHDFVSAPANAGIRLLEFGCGAGMNLIHLVSILKREKFPLEAAFGTDFSQKLVEVAEKEKRNYLASEQQQQVKFLTARNESLVTDMAGGLKIPKSDLLGSFHLILGINTFRYCHRLGKEEECAKDIFDLLMPGGVCVMIDMNRKFPLFRSLIRDRLSIPERERYLPSLEEYSAPFGAVGFQILERRNFCWVPHSAGPVLLTACRILTPLLNLLVPRFAMRSLVVSKKPDQSHLLRTTS